MLAILLYIIALAFAIILVIYYFACTYETWDDDDEDDKEDIHLAWGCPRIIKSVLQEYPDERKKPHVGHLPGSYEPPLLEPHKDVGDKQG